MILSVVPHRMMLDSILKPSIILIWGWMRLSNNLQKCLLLVSCRTDYSLHNHTVSQVYRKVVMYGPMRRWTDTGYLTEKLGIYRRNRLNRENRSLFSWKLNRMQAYRELYGCNCKKSPCSLTTYAANVAAEDYLRAILLTSTASDICRFELCNALEC